jgi:hypothetical protein
MGVLIKEKGNSRVGMRALAMAAPRPAEEAVMRATFVVAMVW